MKEILKYINQQIIPEDKSSLQKSRFIKKCSEFKSIKNILYKKDANNNDKKVMGIAKANPSSCGIKFPRKTPLIVDTCHMNHRANPDPKT